MGLRDGVEKAWLEKNEDYVQGTVAAEVRGYQCCSLEEEGRQKEEDLLGNRNQNEGCKGLILMGEVMGLHS